MQNQTDYDKLLADLLKEIQSLRHIFPKKEKARIQELYKLTLELHDKFKEELRETLK